MKRVAQVPSHYEVELHQHGQTGAARRSIKRMGPDGFVSALPFATLAATQTYAKRLNRQETRIVAVERDGWRRTVDVGEA